MTAATACCTTNSVFYQIQLIPTRSQFTPILSRSTTLPTSSSIIPTLHIEQKQQSKVKKSIISDENNNHDDDHHIPIDDDVTVNDVDEDEFLSCVGLRRKTKKTSIPIRILPPLMKRLAAPVCLLPLGKYGERVRQALYILLPFLKFLSITYDIDIFCSTDEKAKTESLLTRSITQTRTSTIVTKKKNERKVPKTEFITMAANTLRNNTSKTPMAKYIHSTIQCQVALDRLDQSAIDQIMQNAIVEDEKSLATIPTAKRTLRNSSQPQKISIAKARRSLKQTTTKTTTTRTTITTMTTEKTTVKQKSTTKSFNDASKRFKTSDNDCVTLSNNDKSLSSSLIYQRIYLKCFVCSKREYIDTQTSNSDVLHLHWLEHGNDLSLNIYDSVIDSILTRVVEFFHSPERHTLEGDIKTMFILNSKEIRQTTTNLSDDDTCIVLD